MFRNFNCFYLHFFDVFKENSKIEIRNAPITELGNPRVKVSETAESDGEATAGAVAGRLLAC